MKKLAIFVFTSLILSGCNTIQPVKDGSIFPKPSSASSSKLVERVGVLLVLRDDDCLLSSGCGPRYSLLSEDLRSRTVALIGNVNQSLEGRLIAVQGKLSQASASSDIDGVLNVQDTIAITHVPTQSFLETQSDKYISEAYGCYLFWDKTYHWHLQGKQPYLSALLHNNNQSEQSIELIYDGISSELKREIKTPDELNPCDS